MRTPKTCVLLGRQMFSVFINSLISGYLPSLGACGGPAASVEATEKQCKGHVDSLYCLCSFTIYTSLSINSLGPLPLPLDTATWDLLKRMKDNQRWLRKSSQTLSAKFLKRKKNPSEGVWCQKTRWAEVSLGGRCIGQKEETGLMGY